MLALAIVLFCLSGCRAPRVVTEVRTVYHRDTVTRADSVYVSRNVYVRGDTVYSRDTVTNWHYRDREIIREKVDSIPYPVEVEVPIRRRNLSDRATATGSWVLFGLFAVWVAWWIVKRYYFHARR